LIRYFDASALAKRYIRAEGTRDVTRWLRAESPAVSRLTEAELSSAFARRVREGTMSEKARLVSLQRVQSDLRSFHIVELSTDLMPSVHDLLARHPLPLGAADAIQLASALIFSTRSGRAVEFVVYDHRLADAAEAEGLRVLTA
jgi:predicted nucleic acid-binding protein